MKYAKVAVVALFAVVMACDSDWCQGTTVHKPKPYTETGGHQSPYYKMSDKPFYIPMGCGDISCSFKPQIYVKLFNPTNRAVRADVTCTFMLGDYEAGKSVKNDIVIPPGTKSKGTMRKVDMEQLLSIQRGSDPTGLEISCDVVFH